MQAFNIKKENARFLFRSLRMAQDFLQHERLSKLQEEVLEELEIMELQPKSWWRAPGATRFFPWKFFHSQFAPENIPGPSGTQNERIGAMLNFGGWKIIMVKMANYLKGNHYWRYTHF